MVVPPRSRPRAAAPPSRPFSAVLALFLVFGCAQPEDGASAEDPPGPTVALRVSLDDLMVQWINPASYRVWDAAREAYAPTDDADWKALEDTALQLVASGTLITVPGTGPSDEEWVRDERWTVWTIDMTDAAERALEAARAQDLDSFVEAGNLLVESCEGCHADFRPAPTY